MAWGEAGKRARVERADGLRQGRQGKAAKDSCATAALESGPAMLTMCDGTWISFSSRHGYPLRGRRILLSKSARNSRTNSTMSAL
eukprot:9476106-Pyramimonas_sp.AAC.1